MSACAVDLVGGNQQSGGLKLRCQTGRGKLPPAFYRRGQNNAKDPFALPDDESVGIAKRSAIAAEFRSQQVRVHRA